MPTRLGAVSVGGYTLVERIGEGGMGVVYRAIQRSLGREVAVKFMRGSRMDDLSRQRFCHEAKITCSLTNAHTVSVFDFGESSEFGPYLVMELLAGENLGRRLARQRVIPTWQAIEIAAAVCDSLEEAHAAGIVHRDLKPDNIFMCRSPHGESAKVLDYGLARRASAHRPHGNPRGRCLSGTPAYMSPEQCRGAPVDPRSDLYSLGATIFEMLACTPPFPGTDDLAVIVSQVMDPAPLLSSLPNTAVPEELCEVVQSLLAKDPEHRPPDAATVRHQLRRMMERWSPKSSAGTVVSPALRARLRRLAGDRTVSAFSDTEVELDISNLLGDESGKP